MATSKRAKTPTARAVARRAGVAARYRAYAVGDDGVRRPLDASAIVVDLGGREIEIELSPRTPLSAGRLSLSANGEGLLFTGSW